MSDLNKVNRGFLAMLPDPPKEDEQEVFKTIGSYQFTIKLFGLVWKFNTSLEKKR